MLHFDLTISSLSGSITYIWTESINFITYADEVSEDHMTALKKRAEIDSKYIITFLLSDTLEKRKSLQRYVGH